jgi:bile acid-coenzyme A ligase
MTKPVPPIGSQISALAEIAPDEPAVSCAGITITRAELDSSTNRLARAYAERGVGLGDYVTIALPNSVEWVQAAVACWKLGAVPQPLSPRLPDAEFEGLLDLRPRALLVGREDPRRGDRKRGEAGRSGSPTERHRVIPNVPAGFVPDPGLSDGPLPEAVSPCWKSLASGGSTGRPKLIEAGGDARVPAAIGAPLGAQEGDITLVPVPLSHNTGCTTAVVALLMRHHLVLMSRFDPHEFLRLITDHRVTFLTTVPTIMQRALPVYHADPDAHDLSSIRRFWHLGAPCPPAIKQAWIDILGAEKVWELYGGTELQALTFISGDQWLTHRGSVGMVVSGEMKVLDDDGNPVPPGVVGEIYMRPNPGSAPTYRYVGVTAKSRDGWDSLGDLGYLDEDGFLYLSDRRVDMFTVGGRNVYPAEIEGALSAHPEVLSCLVVGVPDPNAGDLGQVPYALVHAADGSALDADAVQEFLRDRIEAYKVPQFVEFVSTPLRDDAGKARRSAVRTEVIARLQNMTGTPEEDALPGTMPLMARDLEYAGLTDVGQLREANQDRWGADAEQRLFIVADGVATSNNGELAAAMVCEMLPKYVSRYLDSVDLDGPEVAERLAGATAELSDDLRKFGETEPSLAGATTTVVAAFVTDSHVYVAHLGDSRAYLYCEKQLVQLTRDHSLVQEMVDAGELDAEAAAHHPARNVITRHVAMAPPSEPDVSMIDVKPGDRLLLCSDGLYGVVEHEALTRIVAEQRSPEDTCAALVQAANSAGGPDNITALVVDIPEAIPEAATEPTD